MGGYAKSTNCYNGPLKSCARKKKGYRGISAIRQFIDWSRDFPMTAENCEMNLCGQNPRCSYWEQRGPNCDLYAAGRGRFYSYRTSVAGSKDC